MFQRVPKSLLNRAMRHPKKSARTPCLPETSVMSALQSDDDALERVQLDIKSELGVQGNNPNG